MSYPFAEIEKKWQRYWKVNSVFRAENSSAKPKFYVLDMFPYPSGAGLHVGHPLGYIASDIVARYKRLKGFNVLHPMGFDAFGLPAEQYAIETGQHPAVTTARNIRRYKAQLESIGLAYDWGREVNTCDPAYYKWTQWIFLQLFQSWYNGSRDRAEPIETLIAEFEKKGTAGVNAATTWRVPFTAEEWKSKPVAQREAVLSHYRLAYPAYALVNWCPALGTVLANDEVKEGRSERGGHPVVRRKMRQWFLRITAYAERLLRGLDELDWPQSLKEMQRNWIGRSEGALVHFPLSGQNGTIEVFTTRIDTVYGATFMVLAPEHELVEKITTAKQKTEVQRYLDYVRSRTDVERQQQKKVTGVFTGAHAVNPFTKQQIPVWIAEYVLIDYGTGAIMAVPADDERDRVFAEKFNLPVTEVIDRSAYPNATTEDKMGRLINSGEFTGMEVPEAIRAMTKRAEEMGVGKAHVSFKLRDAGFSRQRYWGEPFPIIYKTSPEGEEYPVPLDENQLPLELPQVESYRPTGDESSPLAANPQWMTLPEGAHRETDTMPGYAGSSWYFLRYMDPHNREKFTGKEAEQYWKNVDLYIGGTEHAVGHLMYARFWHRFFYDRCWISTEEPFKKLINQGMMQGRSNIAYRISGTNRFVSQGLKSQYNTTPVHVDINIVNDDVLDVAAFKKCKSEFRDAEFLQEDGKYYCGVVIEKMSKRWHNVVNPDDVIAKYGADCFRMYEMFLGPLEQHKPWDTRGIEGVSRFLNKVWRLFHDEDGKFIVSGDEPGEQEWRALHLAVKKVGEDIERCSFNTGVSALMICVNELSVLNCHKRVVLEMLSVVLSPYAPHLAEELWKKLGHHQSIFLTAFPAYEKKYVQENIVVYPVSFNGKKRFTLELPAGLSEEEIKTKVLASEESRKWMNGKPPKKVIVVPGRIVNIVH